MDTQALVPILSIYAKKLGSTVEMAGLIVGAYSIVHVPASVVFGRIIDKVGRKLPLIIGLASDAVSMILYAVSMNPFYLYAGIVGGVAVGAPITGLVAATWGISLGLVSSFVAPFVAIFAVLILS